MNPSVASLICAFGIAGLFYLNRGNTVSTSKALWLPVIWLWIIGSRAVSLWLSIWFGIRFGSPAGGLQAEIDGSPVDAVIFAVLLAAGIMVLSSRSRRASVLIMANLPILVYFAFCLLSLLWAPLAEVGFKRWIKAFGDPVMALVVVSERDPIAAIRCLFSRVGFILLPASILLIKYFAFGRAYDPSGNQMYIGVTTAKNSLGLIVFLISLGALWSFLHLLRARRHLGRARKLVAQGTLLAFGIALLVIAQSATSIACFALGSALILAPHLQWIKTRPARIHALVLAILVLGGLAMLFGGEGVAIHALGRQTNLTGRTEIWRAIIPACPNPVLGAGFESFWIGPDVRKVWYQLSNWWGGGHINEAHNGYIEVYLNLGFVGLGLIAWILISGYKRIDAALRCKSESAGLMLALVGTAAIYSVTEAGFRMLNPMWFFLLLAVFGARGTTRVPSVSSAAGRRNLAARAREELALGRPPLTSAYSRSSMEG